MATVRFNAPEEFVEELARDADRVHRRIVRVTCRYSASRLSPNIHHLSVVASALVDGQVIQLERYVGDIWRIPEEDGKVYAQRDQVMGELAQRLAALGLEVRAGVLEEAP